MQVQLKVASSDLVTETDKKVEEIIFTALREKYPTHKLASWPNVLLINALNAVPVFEIYKHQRMSIITNALTYTWKTKH